MVVFFGHREQTAPLNIEYPKLKKKQILEWNICTGWFSFVHKLKFPEARVSGLVLRSFV